MEGTRPIDTVDETLGCFCLRWSTDDKLGHSLRRDSVILEQGGINVKE